MRIILIVVPLAGLLALSSKSQCQESTLFNRHAIAVQPGNLADSASDVRYVEHGWNAIESALFYSTNQGSRLIPYDWFLALEEAGSEQLVRDNTHLDRLRFLPRSPSELNPDGLPVGFVKDPASATSRIDWLGLTCAACHTSQVNYQRRAYRIDGAPGQADIQTFLSEITATLKATLNDQTKFARFADRVLKDRKDNQSEREALRDRLTDVASFRQQFDNRNVSPHAYGYARVDAFGIILNEVLQHALDIPA